MNGSSNDAAWLSEDELRLYVSRAPPRSTDYQLCLAERANAEDAFGECRVLPVNSTSADRFPYLIGNEQTLYFQSNRVRGGNDYDLFVAVRDPVDQSWNDPISLAALTTTERQELGSLLGRVLYFASADQLYTVLLDHLGNPSTPDPIEELNTASRETHPVISSDGLTIYFSRTNLYSAVRDTPNGTFGLPAEVAQLNSLGEDYPTWISADDCTIIIGSSRIRGGQSYDLYMAKRPKLHAGDRERPRAR